MTRGEMRTIVRRRVKDGNSIAWTDAQIDDELNRSAAEVARQASRYQVINYAKGSESFTTTADDQTYVLSGTDIRRIFAMKRTDCSPHQPCALISELDELNINSNYWGGYWRYFITRNPSSAAFTVNFPHYQVQAGLTFTVQYIARMSEIATGGASDTSIYTAVDVDHHELIVQQCCVNLLGQESSMGQIAVMKLEELRDEMVRDLSVTATPDMIQQEF